MKAKKGEKLTEKPTTAAAAQKNEHIKWTSTVHARVVNGGW